MSEQNLPLNLATRARATSALAANGRGYLVTAKPSVSASRATGLYVILIAGALPFLFPCSS